MADASGDALKALQSQSSLQYGDYNVTKDWMYTTNPLNGWSNTNGVLFFNPNDTTQKFTLSDPNSAQAQQLYDYTQQLSGGYTGLEQYFAGQANTGPYADKGVYSGLFATPSLEQLAEQQRLADLTAQYQSGAMTREQLEGAANSSPASLDYQNVYGNVYNQVKSQPTQTSQTSTNNQQTQGLQFPSFDDALLQEYRSRPDLQALYNIDGSPKNPNDSRIAGIPTLQEWAMKYGVNESQLLKTAQANQTGRNSPSAMLPTTPVSLNPSTQVQSSQLTNLKNDADVQSILQGNTKKYGDLRDQILKSLMPSTQELNLEKRLVDLDTMSRNLNLSAQAGINKIKNQPVAMQFIVGQTRSVMEDANLQLQTLAAEKASVVDRLGLAQRARETSLNVLNTIYQFQKEDEATKEQADKLKRAEQEAAKEFALQYGITAPFYQIGTTVYNTSTGKPYSTPEEFFKAGGARDWSNIQKVEIQQDELEGAPTSYKEYQYAVKDGYTGTYNDYQNMDANRKRSVSNNTTINQTNKTEDRVRQIVQMNPNNWYGAAAQIDKEFGAGTATLYDSYLKDAYKPKRD